MYPAWQANRATLMSVDITELLLHLALHFQVHPPVTYLIIDAITA